MKKENPDMHIAVHLSSKFFKTNLNFFIGAGGKIMFFSRRCSVTQAGREPHLIKCSKMISEGVFFATPF